jgi:ketopantoate reductase
LKVCVVGAGSIGGCVAAGLALVDNGLIALTRRGALDKLKVNEAGEAHTA